MESGCICDHDLSLSAYKQNTVISFVLGALKLYAQCNTVGFITSREKDMIALCMPSHIGHDYGVPHIPLILVLCSSTEEGKASSLGVLLLASYSANT